MKFKERLEKMVASGAITPDQASGFEAGITSVTMPMSAGAKDPVSKLPFIAGATICVGTALYILFSHLTVEEGCIQEIQNVAETMNTLGSTGEIGGGMSALMITTILGLPLIGVWALFLPFLYNRFVALTAEMDAAQAHVQSCYQKRADLLTNLMSIVREYMGQESDIHGEVSHTRSTEPKKEDLSEALETLKAATEEDNDLQESLGHGAAAKLFAVAEGYPELQASDNVKQLQSQFEATEDQVNVARMYYNDAVRDYNQAIGKIPGNLVASWGGFKPRAYFEAETTADKTINV